MSMKVLGRSTAKLHQFASSRGQVLDDIELVADAATLRRLASFLSQVASEMESEGERFEHRHLLDEWGAHGSGIPDIVISREQ
jgi:hypothetical protein